MKSKEQLEARLTEAREQKQFWVNEARVARDTFEDESYIEYSHRNAQEFNGQIELLLWILAD